MKVAKINNLVSGTQSPVPSAQSQVPSSNNVTI